MTAFFDSNVLIYRLIEDDPRRAIAQQLLEKGGALSVQVLNEFSSVAHRKLKLTWTDVAVALSAIRKVLPPPLPLTVVTHEQALRLAERHRFAFYDALIVAAALEGNCDTLLSEDMQHGMIVENRLTIVNPFRDV